MMKTASTQIASADGQSAPQSTKVRTAARPGGLKRGGQGPPPPVIIDVHVRIDFEENAK